MQSLADGIMSPTELMFGLTLAQTERRHRFRHVAPPLGTMEGICRFLEQGNHRFCQCHCATFSLGRWHCTDFQRANYFPVFA